MLSKRVSCAVYYSPCELECSFAHMQYVLALSRILISPDIWIHFWIKIGILDHFGFVLKYRCWYRWQRAGLSLHVDTVQ